MTETPGVQILSDGTSEGTHVLLDGRPVRGAVGARWEIAPSSRRATLTLELKNVTIDAHAAISPEVREQLDRLVGKLP